MIASHTSYNRIATEYYDEKLHPTCANFGALSAEFLIPRIRARAIVSDQILEVGAGRSIVAPVLEELSLPLGKLTLVDSAVSMLAHSKRWVELGARAIEADARFTGLPHASIDLVVSSLGDPYNCDAFWREMRRVMKVGGTCLFTTPSFEWAASFRHLSPFDAAHFQLLDGRDIFVPSFVLPLNEQVDLIASAGFVAIEMVRFRLRDLEGHRSPKFDGMHEDAPVVYGLTLQIGN